MDSNPQALDDYRDLYPAIIAPMLRQASGTWHRIRRDKHNRIYALISKYRKDPPRPYRSKRFQFKAVSAGFGSRETWLVARHMPVTFPIPSEVAATIAKRTELGLIPSPTADDYEPEQEYPTTPPRVHESASLESLRKFANE